MTDTAILVVIDVRQAVRRLLTGRIREASGNWSDYIHASRIVVAWRDEQASMGVPVPGYKRLIDEVATYCNV